jgi:hypothetical protein
MSLRDVEAAGGPGHSSVARYEKGLAWPTGGRLLDWVHALRLDVVLLPRAGR